MAYAKPDPANPTAPWKVHKISEQVSRERARHGRRRYQRRRPHGHREQPRLVGAAGHGRRAKTLWTFQPAQFGSGGAEMGVYDVNGDGLNDVVTAHRGARMGPRLVRAEARQAGRHFVRPARHHGRFSTKNAGGVTFSEPHGATFADMDGDGVPDMIIGKRLFSHLESYLDPDPYGPPCFTGTGRFAIRRPRAARNSFRS